MKKRPWLLIIMALALVILVFNPAVLLGVILVIFLIRLKLRKSGSPEGAAENGGQNVTGEMRAAEAVFAAFKPLIRPDSVNLVNMEVKTALLEAGKKGLAVAAPRRPALQKRRKYLHIALNSTLAEAEEIIQNLPPSDRILIEAGTPLIKIYGAEAISRIKRQAPPGTYIVADTKCADLAYREAEMTAQAGANAATCLGVAPIETINGFIVACRQFGIDSIIDMMNVENALFVLKKLKNLPDVVMLHRGVDESEFSKEKQIPYYQIKQVKGSYNILVAVAGGDTIHEIQRAIFNGADIVVVWKSFYAPTAETAALAEEFLKEIK